MRPLSPWTLGTLIASNLVPLVGVLWLDWDIKYLVLSYWFENLVIGGYTILRMATAGMQFALRSPLSFFAYLLLCLIGISFFLAHYGGFCAVHGFFLLALFGDGSAAPLDQILDGAFQWPFLFVSVGLLVQVLKAILAQSPPGIEWMVAGLAFSHGTPFVRDYLGRGEFREAAASNEMVKPYKHIVFMHLSIMAGGLPVALLGSPLPLLILLIAGKIRLDLWLLQREQVQAAGPQFAKRKRTRKNSG